MTTTATPFHPFCVRQMTTDDIPAVIDLQVRAFPWLTPVEGRADPEPSDCFPEGQLVVRLTRQAPFWVLPVRC
jgi:hypothetical protein